jgi:hypothetical protein
MTQKHSFVVVVTHIQVLGNYNLGKSGLIKTLQVQEYFNTKYVCISHSW